MNGALDLAKRIQEGSHEFTCVYDIDAIAVFVAAASVVERAFVDMHAHCSAAFCTDSSACRYKEFRGGAADVRSANIQLVIGTADGGDRDDVAYRRSSDHSLHNSRAVRDDAPSDGGGGR